MKLTRRQLAAAVIAPAALAAAPQPPPADELQAARERILNATNALNTVQIPMSTEPAFQFKAG